MKAWPRSAGARAVRRNQNIALFGMFVRKTCSDLTTCIGLRPGPTVPDLGIPYEGYASNNMIRYL